MQEVRQSQSLDYARNFAIAAQAKAIKEKNKKSSSAFLEAKIHEVSEKLKQCILKDKEKYYNKQLPDFIKTAPEKFWRSIAPVSRSTDAFIINGQHVSDNVQVSAAFNNTFKKVFTKDDGRLPPFSMSLPSMPDVIISEEGVFNLLLKLDIKKSPGPDDIPNAFLKQYAEWCSKYLCVLFTRSLKEGVLPCDWKTARIKPLHKSGEKTCIENYRPISLTSTTCKLLEHIIHKHLTNFLDEHNVLAAVQHGFRRGYSTCTQLVETIHDFATAINEGKQTDVIFMDFRKAFDKVSHKKLLHKLSFIINNKQILTWIQSYLSDRRQFVELHKTCSNYVPVDSGVPQGSVLGPYCF